jgi:hypothetical protein
MWLRDARDVSAKVDDKHSSMFAQAVAAVWSSAMHVYLENVLDSHIQDSCYQL